MLVHMAADGRFGDLPADTVVTMIVYLVAVDSLFVMSGGTVVSMPAVTVVVDSLMDMIVDPGFRYSVVDLPVHMEVVDSFVALPVNTVVVD